jgi:hypothetical protein
MKWRNELSLAPRIPRCEQSRIEQCVRYIATPAAGNAHFGKKLRAALEQRDSIICFCLRGRDRSKKTRGTATDDCDFSHSLTYRISKAGKEEADPKSKNFEPRIRTQNAPFRSRWRPEKARMLVVEFSS